jgi:Flp pilus assembly protein TadD
MAAWALLLVALSLLSASPAVAQGFPEEPPELFPDTPAPPRPAPPPRDRKQGTKPPAETEPAETGIEVPRDKPEVRVLRTGGLRMETAALLLSGQEGGDLPFEALAFPLQADGARVRVPVIVEVDGAALLADHRGDLLRFDVSVYALGGKGEVLGALADTVEIDLARRGAQVAKSGVKLVGELSLLPGDCSLRVLVQNPETRRVGLRVLPLSVPDPKAGGTLLLPPLFAAAKDAWLAVRAVESKGLAPALPRLAGDAPPAARPILVADREAAFEAPVLGLAAGDPGLRLEVLRPNGEKAADLPVHLGARQPTAVPGLELLAATFTPHGLEPGPYVARLAAPGGAARSFGTPFILARDDVGGRVWAEFTPGHAAPAAAAAEGGGAAQSAGPTARQRRRRGDTTPVEAGYREAFRQLAAGQEEAARAAVTALETAAVGKGKLDPEDLLDAEARVARRLAAADPEGLVPVALLHTRLYHDYTARKQYLLATHARETALGLTELYGKKSASPQARQVAAGLVLALAGELAASAPAGLRERVFRRVVALDPDNEAALLCLAVDAERQGRPPEALTALDRLLRAHPGNGEAQLRRALALGRLGRRTEARRQLAELVAAPDAATAWWFPIAYQELARLAIDEESWDAAEKILRTGLERLPGDEKLLLELAALYDRRGRPADARALLAGWQPAGRAEPETASARRRYTQLPLARLAAAHAGLEQSAAERLPSLAAGMRGAAAGAQ